MLMLNLGSESVETCLQSISTSKNPDDLSPLNTALDAVKSTLNVLADCVLHEQPPVRRRKLQNCL
jgi:dynein heavy chain 1